MKFGMKYLADFSTYQNLHYHILLLNRVVNHREIIFRKIQLAVSSEEIETTIVWIVVLVI